MGDAAWTDLAGGREWIGKGTPRGPPGFPPVPIHRGTPLGFPGPLRSTEAALTQLYRYAEAWAIDAIDWFLQDKRGKRIWSRGLRLLVILLVTAGGLQPCWTPPPPGPSRTAWGYVLLALAAARSGARNVDPKQAQTRLALLRAVSDDMAALMQQETAEWVLEFQSNLLRLETSTRGRPPTAA